MNTFPLSKIKMLLYSMFKFGTTNKKIPNLQFQSHRLIPVQGSKGHLWDRCIIPEVRRPSENPSCNFPLWHLGYKSYPWTCVCFPSRYWFWQTFFKSTKKELHGTLDTLWSEYTLLNHKNDTFGINEFIWNSKDITDGNIHLWHQKYSLPSTKVLGFADCRVTSKILAIGSAERS